MLVISFSDKLILFFQLDPLFHFSISFVNFKNCLEKSLIRWTFNGTWQCRTMIKSMCQLHRQVNNEQIIRSYNSLFTSSLQWKDSNLSFYWVSIYKWFVMSGQQPFSMLTVSTADEMKYPIFYGKSINIFFSYLPESFIYSISDIF